MEVLGKEQFFVRQCHGFSYIHVICIMTDSLEPSQVINIDIWIQNLLWFAHHNSFLSNKYLNITQ